MTRVSAASTSLDSRRCECRRRSGRRSAARYPQRSARRYSGSGDGKGRRPCHTRADPPISSGNGGPGRRDQWGREQATTRPRIVAAVWGDGDGANMVRRIAAGRSDRREAPRVSQTPVGLKVPGAAGAARCSWSQGRRRTPPHRRSPRGRHARRRQQVRRRGGRSTRRSGPSTRAGSSRGRRSRPRRSCGPERRQGDDRVPGVVERGPDELRHAGVEDDLAAAAVADVQHARDEPAGPGDQRPPRFDREAGRTTVGGTPSRSAGSSRANRSGPGDGSPSRPHREAAADVERVERLDRPAPQRGHRERPADGVAPRIDGAQLRADVEVDAARDEGPSARRRHLDRRTARSRSSRTGGTAADGERRDGLRRDIRVDPVEDTSRAVARGRAAAAASADERPGLLERLRARPSAAGWPSAAARRRRRGRRRSLADPSSVMRSSGRPARRARAHSPRDTTFAPKPSAATAAMTAGTSLALTEYWRSHGSGNAARTAAAGRRENREVGDEDRRPGSRRPRRSGRAGRGDGFGTSAWPLSRGGQPNDASPSIEHEHDRHLITIEPSSALVRVGRARAGSRRS